jgi:hypothetical protein
MKTSTFFGYLVFAVVTAITVVVVFASTLPERDLVLVMHNAMTDPSSD